MIFRVVKSFWNLILFYILAYVIAVLSANIIGDAINVFVFEHTKLYHNLSAFGEDFILAFTNETQRFLIFFAVIVLIYSSIMAKHQCTAVGKNIDDIIYKVPRKIVNFIVNFKKPTWFWLLCWVTAFIPIIVLLGLWIVLRIALFVITIVLSPIVFPVSQILLAVNGAIK